jgi:hypothetical protein
MTARQRALALAGLVAAGFAALAVRVVVEGRGALAIGDRAYAERRVDDALASWETAARWYLPLAPHVDEAYARLRDHALAHPGTPSADLAWQAVRGAAHATRGLWTPHADDLAEADAALAAARAADPGAAPILDPSARQAWHAERLARDLGPDRGAVGLAVAGIVAWLVGVALLVRRATAVRVAGTAAGLAAWLLGVYLV